MTRPAHGSVDVDALRKEFVRLLTTDSETHDRRRRDFNQAIFTADEGWAIWSSTDLNMVMDKFEDAARNVVRGLDPRDLPDPLDDATDLGGDEDRP